MSESIETYLIAQTSLRLLVDIIFLGFYIMRINKLDKMASNNFHLKTKLMSAKIWLLVFLQILFLLHIILAYADTSYWMYPYENFSLVWIAQLIICLLQIYIIRKQHKKKAIKANSLPILWTLWLIFNLIMIIYTEVINFLDEDYSPQYNAIDLVALILIGWFLQSKDSNHYSFRTNHQSFRRNIDTPLIIDSIKPNNNMNSNMNSNSINNNNSLNRSLQINQDVNKLYVEFNKQFNIVNKNEQIYCQFKFAVFIAQQQSYILNKSQQQFINLAAQMFNIFPTAAQAKLKDYKKVGINNMKKYGEEMQKFYQSYLVNLTKNEKFYMTPLLDFLNINQVHRIKLIKKRQNNLYQKKDSFPNIQYQEQHNRKSFFKVQILSNKIHISNPQILQIIVNKSKLQIQKFHNKLIAQKKLKIQLLTSQPDINQISHFIFRVVNSKNLWRYFSEWMVLGKQLQQKIYNMFDFWIYGFRNIHLNIIGYQIAFDKQGSIHNLYLLSLTQKIEGNHIQDQKLPYFKEDFTLKKRYNDFVKLDRSIKKFISTNNIKNTSIMSLPPKFSPFGTKTSPKSRQVYLDMYLNEVLKIQNISNCVKFLQFLEVDLGRFRQEFYPINQKELLQEHMTSFIIDQLDNRF